MFGGVNRLVKTSGQRGELSLAGKVIDAINNLLKLHDRLCLSGNNNCINDIKEFDKCGGGLCEFGFLQSYINCEEEPPIESLTIMKFLHPILADKKLYGELFVLNDFVGDFCSTSGSTNYEAISSQLSKIVEGFKLEDLKNKIRLLVLLREEMDFANIQKAYDNWYFNGLIGNINFRQEYVNKAVEERERPVSENFKENIDKYVKSVEEGKEVASRYFKREEVNFQAYCEEIGDTNRTLNVNLINYNGSEPIKISDILQQEENIGGLNIYCNGKREVHAFREGEKRYYEFKEGACYQMTSEWPTDESGRVVSTCTMVMNVSSDGITKIVKFNGKEFNGEDYTLLSEEDKKLIEKNQELYIKGLPLCEAVEEFLKKQRGLGCGEGIIPIRNEERNLAFLPDIVPIGATNSEVLEVHHENMGYNTENQRIFRSEVCIVLENNKGNVSSNPTSTTNSGASIPTEVNLRDSETQTETTSKQITDLKSENQRLKEENTEYKQFIEAGLQEMNKKFSALKKEIQGSSNELRNISVENDNLRNKLKKKEQKLKAREGEMYELLNHIQDPECLQGIIRVLQREMLVAPYLNDERNMIGKSGTEHNFNYDEYLKQNDKLRLGDKSIEFIKCLRDLAGRISLNDNDVCSSDKEPGNTCSNSSVSTQTSNRMSLRAPGRQ